MPYVGDDVHRATTKRKWDLDGNETLRFSHPGSNAAVFHVLNQQAGLEGTADGVLARKTLPPMKRLRAIHDTDSSRCELLVTTPSQAAAHDGGNSAACKGPVKIAGMTIMPCHVCHRRPTKKADLDSFARCQSCHEQTCFVCIRECTRQKGPHNDTNPSPLLEKEIEDVGQSFNMNDADECDMSTATTANGSAHHAMICSRCCVEEGAEGEVVCLGCLSNMDTA
ncbi:hypothetical protein ACQKWADRAFT_287896 [Trichoderma austrokoningii]